MEPLSNSEDSPENDSHGSANTIEVESIEVGSYSSWIEFREEPIEVVEVRRIIDLRNYPIETNEDWHLYEEWNKGSKWVYILFFIEFEHLHSECCTIIFVFFLEGFDFWLNCLELLLTHEHVMLRNKEYESYNECHDDNCPSE